MFFPEAQVRVWLYTRYAMARVASLKVFLSDPDVPIDTNHLERALRPIPMGRRYVQSIIM